MWTNWFLAVDRVDTLKQTSVRHAASGHSTDIIIRGTARIFFIEDIWRQSLVCGQRWACYSWLVCGMFASCRTCVRRLCLDYQDDLALSIPVLSLLQLSLRKLCKPKIKFNLPTRAQVLLLKKLTNEMKLHWRKIDCMFYFVISKLKLNQISTLPSWLKLVFPLLNFRLHTAKEAKDAYMGENKVSSYDV